MPAHVGRAILPAAGFPAGWTRWKAGPRPRMAAPQSHEFSERCRCICLSLQGVSDESAAGFSPPLALYLLTRGSTLGAPARPNLCFLCARLLALHFASLRFLSGLRVSAVKILVLTIYKNRPHVLNHLQGPLARTRKSPC
jgi:hypothetical protein